jgi:hypothetical protein
MRLKRLPVARDMVAVVALFAVLCALFFPFVIGRSNLLSSASAVQSITPSGAFGNATPRYVLTNPDAGAPGWVTEPGLALEHALLKGTPTAMLWNPYVGYGAPLAADMQLQPFYPLTVLAALHPSPHTYTWFILARLFIAGLSAFLFLRLFLGTAPSLLGGIATMLSGYYLIYYNMPHLSVEALVPTLFLAIEFAIRSRARWSLSALAAVVLALVLGGMPESTILALTFGAAYVGCRCLIDRADAARIALRCGGGIALGMLSSSFLLLPFFEYLRLSFDIHQPGNMGGVFMGLAHDEDPKQLATYIMPLIFGPTRNDIFEQFGGYTFLRGYFGISVFFLALVGTFHAFARRRARVDSVAMFFAASALMLVCKRFGAPLANEIGRLPFYRFVIFPKYDEALIGFAVAALAAFGLSALVRRESSRWQVCVAAFICLASIALAYFSTRSALGAAIHLEYYYRSIGAALLFLTAIVTVTIILMMRPTPVAASVVIFIVAAELATIYFMPLHYIVNREPSASSNPYGGAPFVSLLQRSSLPSESRVFARDNYLYPNWTEAFGLAGITNLDAVYVARYLRFLNGFLTKNTPSSGDLFDRFTGEHLKISSPQAVRLLQLSSVRYVVQRPQDLFRAGSVLHTGGAVFRVLYDDGVNVLELAPTLPRAALFTNILLVPDDDAALNRLVSSSFDLFGKAVVSDKNLEPSDRASLAALPQSGIAATPARITSYLASRVVVATENPRPSLLMLNDTSYPGWAGYVDGVPAHVLSVDYLFRGIIVPAGKHDVIFAYEPQSLRIGAMITLGALVLGVLYLFLPKGREPRPS